MNFKKIVKSTLVVVFSLGLTISIAAAEWHYVNSAGSTSGPVGVPVLKQMYQNHRINDSTYLWNGSTVNQWTPLSQIPSLLRELKSSNVTPRRPVTGPRNPRKAKRINKSRNSKKKLIKKPPQFNK